MNDRAELSEGLAIRPADFGDLLAIEDLLRETFPTSAEARLVRLLTVAGKAPVSLIAEAGADLVGHVLFSPLTIASQAGRPPLGLAPLAVRPTWQRRGIGAALVRAGLAACFQQGAPGVFVLGEPAYYARFGFAPAARDGYEGEFGGGDAFQVLWFGAAPAGRGCVRYAAAFRQVFAG